MLTLPGSWNEALAAHTAGAGFRNLCARIACERQTQQVFPPAGDVFRALELTDLAQVKVVILGQDPYHDENQAHGLAFSVPDGVKLPPSLRNIYKELADEYGWVFMPENGDLSSWARQGVLLLNTVLTVRAHQANSHAKMGWEEFTDEVIRAVSLNSTQPVVFILWGNPAQKKRKLIDVKRHHVLCCAHPSPLSAYRGFFGSNIFRRTNELLVQSDRSPIEWNVDRFN
ncbi:MAG: uracil-DNA glycosylase [Lentisphaerae bacterium]|nr:uracil-DNA glycosylase [Lentisphaerota bacterium]